MPRLLSRALLVLGGATAATAAAWLLSSQTAAAESLPPVPSATVQAVSTAPTVSTSDAAAAPFSTPLSTTVSSVADPVTDTGSTAVDAVTEPSQHAVLPLPAVQDTTSAGLGGLTSGLRGTVGRLDERLPVGRDLPAQLIQHLTRTPVSTPAAPSVAVPVPAATTPHHITVQDGPFAGQHSRIGGVLRRGAGPFAGDRGRQHAPHNQGSVPFGPLVPAMPGNGGNGGGFAGPAGLGLTSGATSAILPELHVVDVLAPAIEPVPVLPGKQPGVTPD
jgi:hypothetical protein